MSRIRTIKPEFWTDEGIGSISAAARLLFIATWNLADDEGLLTWTPAYIRAQVFAYDNFSIEDIKALMAEVENTGLVFSYKDSNQKQYGWIVNFRKHQKIDKPQIAKNPLPSLQNKDIRERYAARDDWRCYLCQEEIPRITNNKAQCLSLDHVNPQKIGGLDAPSNIKAVHFGCNSSKKDRLFVEYSENDIGIVNDSSPLERKGKEGKGKEDNICSTHPRGELKKQATEVLIFLNAKTGRNYRLVDANLDFVIARLKSGITVEDCRAVIAKKAREWKSDEKMELYLRPATLFNKTKFEQYVGELLPEEKHHERVS